MHAGNDRRAVQARTRCPRCAAPCGAPNLLTSWTRYYACGRCACRWQVARIDDSDSPASGAARGAQWILTATSMLLGCLLTAAAASDQIAEVTGHDFTVPGGTQTAMASHTQFGTCFREPGGFIDTYGV
jgi:hypothetical protein